MANQYVELLRNENQARGIASYAIDFLSGRLGQPDESVYRMVERLHLDSIACGVSALACGTNAPTVLRRERSNIPATIPRAAFPAWARPCA